MYFYQEKGEIQKSKKSIKKNLKEKIRSSSINGKRTATHVLCHSTSSFGNKSFVALDWSSKSRKCHCYLPKCDQGKELERKYSFEKNIIF